MLGKIGVLLVNLGTPDAPTRGAVWRYLQEFLTDRRVIDIPAVPRNILVRGIIAPLRSGKSAKAYKDLWTEGGSPLKFYGERVAMGVQARLGDDYHVELAMRYQSPSIADALGRLLENPIRELIVFPMFPQYASATTGSIHDKVMELLRKKDTIPPVRFINSYYDDPAMVDLYAENARQFDLYSYDHVLFSYHGLPQRQLRKADDYNHCLKVDNCCGSITAANQFCYSAQCHATARLIADNLGLTPEQYTICFQSRLGPDKWAQPYTIKTIEEWAKKGAKRLLVFSPAFVSDCLETTIEIADEYQEEFEEWGGEKIDLVPSLNDDPRWMDVITNLVKGETTTAREAVALPAVGER